MCHHCDLIGWIVTSWTCIRLRWAVRRKVCHSVILFCVYFLCQQKDSRPPTSWSLAKRAFFPWIFVQRTGSECGCFWWACLWCCLIAPIKWSRPSVEGRHVRRRGSLCRKPLPCSYGSSRLWLTYSVVVHSRRLASVTTYWATLLPDVSYARSPPEDHLLIGRSRWKDCYWRKAWKGWKV